MMGHPTAWRQRIGWLREGKGDRATTGWMVVPFDAMGKSVGKRSGVGWGGNDQGFGVYDAFKMSKC